MADRDDARTPRRHRAGSGARSTDGGSGEEEDRGGARGAGDAATFSLFAARRGRPPRHPSSSLFSVAKNSLLSRGKKIHPGVTWRIRKLPTCDATKNSDDDDALGTSAPLPPRSPKHTAPRVFSRSPPDHHVCHLLLRRDGATRVVAPDPARLAPRRARAVARRAGRKTNNRRMRSAGPRLRRTTDDPIPDRSVVHSQVVRAPRVAAARRAPHNGVAVRCARSTTRRPPPAVPSSASRSPRRGGNI